MKLDERRGKIGQQKLRSPPPPPWDPTTCEVGTSGASSGETMLDVVEKRLLPLKKSINRKNM